MAHELQLYLSTMTYVLKYQVNVDVSYGVPFWFIWFVLFI